MKQMDYINFFPCSKRVWEKCHGKITTQARDIVCDNFGVKFLELFKIILFCLIWSLKLILWLHFMFVKTRGLLFLCGLIHQCVQGAKIQFMVYLSRLKFKHVTRQHFQKSKKCQTSSEAKTLKWTLLILQFKSAKISKIHKDN